MSEDLDEFRQPYRTPSERAALRKKMAGAYNPFAATALPEHAGEQPDIHINIWKVTQQLDGATKYVRCPSRSGAKIYAAGHLGMVGPFFTETVDAAPEGDTVHTAVFETVQEFAVRVEQEKRLKR